MVGIATCDVCGCDDCETQSYPAYDEHDSKLESANVCMQCAYDMGLEWYMEDGDYPEWDDPDNPDNYSSMNDYKARHDGGAK